MSKSCKIDTNSYSVVEFLSSLRPKKGKQTNKNSAYCRKLFPEQLQLSVFAQHDNYAQRLAVSLFSKINIIMLEKYNLIQNGIKMFQHNSSIETKMAKHAQDCQ